MLEGPGKFRIAIPTPHLGQQSPQAVQPGIGRVVAFEAPDHQLQAGHVPCSVGMEPLLEDLLCHRSRHAHGLGAIRLRQRRDK